MNELYTTEWWLWRLYRQVSRFVHQPEPATEAQLRSLIAAYGEFARQEHCASGCRRDLPGAPEHPAHPPQPRR